MKYLKKIILTVNIILPFGNLAIYSIVLFIVLSEVHIILNQYF